MANTNGTTQSDEAGAISPNLKVAPIGVLVDLLRVVPGHESSCLSGRTPHNAINCLVLGEWDLLRLSLAQNFFPRAKSTKHWPPIGVPIRNQHSFLGHIWVNSKATSSSSAIHQSTSGTWSFSSAFRDNNRPVTLLICAKLHPDITGHCGIQADIAAIKYIEQKAAERDLLILPAGSIGWQEIICIVRAFTFDQARELIRDIYDAPVAALLPEAYKIPNKPLVVRTITYPCIFPDGLSGSSKRYLSLSNENHNAKLLLDARPGTGNPLKSGEIPVSELGTMQIGDTKCYIRELFGEYDFEITFQKDTPLPSILTAIKILRNTNLGGWNNWLIGTSLVLDFDWRYGNQHTSDSSATPPLRPPIDPEALKGNISAFRWSGVDNMHAERLVRILRHVFSYSTDPVLADSVQPLLRYFKSLDRQVKELRDTLGDGEPEPASIVIEDEDIDQLCSILEFSLRQRSEGLQQFLFNALPSSYYSRGGLNRLLVGADAILQEVSRIFGLINPGFVVFGLPTQDGFACFGPIVIASLPALFRLEWWWVIYHETSLYIDDQIFKLQFADRFLADLITLTFPFHLDLRLFKRMHAYRLALAEPNRAKIATLGILARLASLFVLKLATEDMRTIFNKDIYLDSPDALAPSWSTVLAEKAHALRTDLAIRSKVASFAEEFISDIRDFSPSYRKDFFKLDDFPYLAPEGTSDLCDGIAEFCDNLRAHCDLACAENSSTFAAGVQLVKSIQKRQISRPTADQPSNSQILTDESLSIYDLVHRAIQRWDLQLSHTKRPILNPPPDVEDRLSESLAVWHRGILSNPTFFNANANATSEASK